MKVGSMNQPEQQQVFDEWIGRHRGLLFKVVRAHAFNPQDRDDLFQEIAAQVWLSIPNFRSEAAVTTWLYRVALHCAMAWARKEKRHRAGRRSLDEQKPALLETPTGRDRRIDWLFDQIAQLDEIDRALTLLLLDGFSYQEMAATLGLSESNVGVKIHRIKNYLTERSRETDRHEL
jgi:RNA polymerase sigma-70 factor (ECF subfamily)